MKLGNDAKSGQGHGPLKAGTRVQIPAKAPPAYADRSRQRLHLCI